MEERKEIRGIGKWIWGEGVEIWMKNCVFRKKIRENESECNKLENWENVFMKKGGILM